MLGMEQPRVPAEFLVMPSLAYSKLMEGVWGGSTSVSARRTRLELPLNGASIQIVALQLAAPAE